MENHPDVHHHDLRRSERHPCEYQVSVMWREAGQDRFVQAKALDICEWGLRLQMPLAPAHQASLTLSAPRLGLAGSASVRHSTRLRNTNFSVGVEFASGFRWKQKD
jgi:hypothetical protein